MAKDIIQQTVKIEKETNKWTLNQFGNFIIQEAIKFFGYNYDTQEKRNFLLNKYNIKRDKLYN